MEQYVVTVVDEKEWQPWGLSWIASLRDLARYKGKVLVVTDDAPPHFLDRLRQTGVNVLVSKGGVRTLAEFAGKNPGLYAFWDSHVYFQEDITAVFGQTPGCVENSSFMVAPSQVWEFLADFQNLASFLDHPATDLMALFTKHFQVLFNRLSPTWAFSDIVSLKKTRDKFLYLDEPIKAVQFTDFFLPLLVEKNIFFWEKHKAVYDNWLNLYGTKTITKKFIKAK